MDAIHTKLDFLLEVLSKANSSQPFLPSPKGPKVVTVPGATLPKLPGAPTNNIKAVSVAPPSKKSPVDVAQQVSNPDTQKIAVKQAKELIKTSPNGQWYLAET